MTQHLHICNISFYRRLVFHVLHGNEAEICPRILEIVYTGRERLIRTRLIRSST